MALNTTTKSRRHAANIQREFAEIVRDAILNAEAQLKDVKSLYNDQDSVVDNMDMERLIAHRIERAAVSAAKAIMPEFFVPTLTLPTKAPQRWCDRDFGNLSESPIDFLERHWGRYINSGLLDQRTLRELDSSLVEGIKIFCRNRGLRPTDYLPSPSREPSKSTKKTKAKRSFEAPNRPLMKRRNSVNSIRV